MSLALDNKFIYPAHMMRSPLSDQFSKVMNRSVRTTKISWPVFIIFFFFYILNSIFKCSFLYLLQITCWHCSIFFFSVRLFWNFKFFFHLQFFACPSVSINVISNIAQCAMTTWQSITSLISIIEIDELNTQVLYKPICLMVLFVECALKAVVSIITLY